MNENINQKQSLVRVIDSNSRSRYSSNEPNGYTIRFSKPIENVYSFSILEASIPNTMYNIDTDTNILIIYQPNVFSEIESDIIQGNNKFEIRVPIGEYKSGVDLQDELNNQFQQNNLDITTTYNETTRIFSFDSQSYFIFDMQNSTIRNVLGFDKHSSNTDPIGKSISINSKFANYVINEIFKPTENDFNGILQVSDPATDFFLQTEYTRILWKSGTNKNNNAIETEALHKKGYTTITDQEIQTYKQEIFDENKISNDVAYYKLRLYTQTYINATGINDGLEFLATSLTDKIYQNNTQFNKDDIEDVLQSKYNEIYTNMISTNKRILDTLSIQEELKRMKANNFVINDKSTVQKTKQEFLQSHNLPNNTTYIDLFHKNKFDAYKEKLITMLTTNFFLTIDNPRLYSSIFVQQNTYKQTISPVNSSPPSDSISITKNRVAVINIENNLPNAISNTYAIIEAYFQFEAINQGTNPNNIYILPDETDTNIRYKIQRKEGNKWITIFPNEGSNPILFYDDKQPTDENASYKNGYINVDLTQELLFFTINRDYRILLFDSDNTNDNTFNSIGLLYDQGSSQKTSSLLYFNTTKTYQQLSYQYEAHFSFFIERVLIRYQLEAPGIDALDEKRLVEIYIPEIQELLSTEEFDYTALVRIGGVGTITTELDFFHVIENEFTPQKISEITVYLRKHKDGKLYTTRGRNHNFRIDFKKYTNTKKIEYV